MTNAALGAEASRVGGRKFYAWMALVCLAVAVLGFIPTYFLPLASGRFQAPPIVHIHGAIFYAWTLFFCVQSWLVASGKVIAHREWGIAGVALATAMGFAVLITYAAMYNFRAAHGFADEALAFGWVQVSGVAFFWTVFALGIANVKKPEVHKRLMLLGTISLLDAPIARIVLTLMMPGPPPVGAPPPIGAILLPGLIADLLIVAAIVYDWRTRGRPHPVYLAGGAALLALQLTREAVSQTSAWHAAATWLVGLGG